MEGIQTIPLFPLNTVLFPNLPLPLHIFEPRYERMIHECLDRGQDFGVVLAHQGRILLNGTTAKIENILNSFDDGRMDILTLGKTRFRILNLKEEKPYLEADVEFWDDETQSQFELKEIFHQVRQVLKEYACLTGKLCDYSLFENYSPYTFSFLLAEINMYPLMRQQEFLEMTQVKERLLCGLKSLEFVLTRLKVDKKLQELLGSQNSYFNIYN